MYTRIAQRRTASSTRLSHRHLPMPRRLMVNASQQVVEAAPEPTLKTWSILTWVSLKQLKCLRRRSRISNRPSLARVETSGSRERLARIWWTHLTATFPKVLLTFMVVSSPQSVARIMAPIPKATSPSIRQRDQIHTSLQPCSTTLDRRAWLQIRTRWPCTPDKCILDKAQSLARIIRSTLSLPRLILVAKTPCLIFWCRAQTQTLRIRSTRSRIRILVHWTGRRTRTRLSGYRQTLDSQLAAAGKFSQIQVVVRKCRRWQLQVFHKQVLRPVLMGCIHTMQAMGSSACLLNSSKLWWSSR